MFIRLINIFFLIIAFSCIFAENQETINVRIRNGLIDGKRQHFDGKNLNVFLGVPYAQPPVGALRFKKPLPMTEWSSTLDAKQWPNSCMHLQHHQDYFHNNMSEDCLYLNIWSPIDQNSEGALKPVLFWIHGGGLTIGSSVEKFYQGHVLAAKGDIVVVTINYRLNVLGFLYTGTNEAPGNMGLWDQALALEWVNDNIKYFGGDPSRITVAGESAGALSTSMHILSPVTRHLFKNAILMSGSVATKIGVCDKESLIKDYKLYLQSIGCPEEEDSQQIFHKQINCFKNLLESNEQVDFPSLAPGENCLCPILNDGYFIPDSPLKMLENNDFKKNFNLLMGSTEDEGSFTLPMGITGARFDRHSPPHVNFSEATTMMNNVFQLFVPELHDDIDKVGKLYLRGLSNNTDSDTLLKAIGIGVGDFALGCPTILFGKKLYEMDPKMNVFHYYFNSKAGDEKLFCAKWMGVCHFNDIYPLFGVPFTDNNKYTEEEREVSQRMIDYFSSFVRTGRPSRQSSAEWHQYYRIDDKIVAPFYEITEKPNSESDFGVGLKIIECEYLWKKYITPNM